ncbi:hypothetical protein HID58_067294, partial [Brassica napus]
TKDAPPLTCCASTSASLQHICVSSAPPSLFRDSVLLFSTYEAQNSVVVSSNQDHVLPLDAIARGDAPCLKRGGGEHQTMENINSGEM